jgi:hypothetical protein
MACNIRESSIMDRTDWVPNTTKDKKEKAYFDRINHAPYLKIASIVLMLLVVFTGLILVGSF